MGSCSLGCILTTWLHTTICFSATTFRQNTGKTICLQCTRCVPCVQKNWCRLTESITLTYHGIWFVITWWTRGVKNANITTSAKSNKTLRSLICNLEVSNKQHTLWHSNVPVSQAVCWSVSIASLYGISALSCQGRAIQQKYFSKRQCFIYTYSRSLISSPSLDAMTRSLLLLPGTAMWPTLLPLNSHWAVSNPVTRIIDKFWETVAAQIIARLLHFPYHPYMQKASKLFAELQNSSLFWM